MTMEKKKPVIAEDKEIDQISGMLDSFQVKDEEEIVETMEQLIIVQD